MGKKHFPPAVWVVFFVLATLMTGGGVLQGTTVLYLIGKLHFNDNYAYSLFAAYHAIIYAICILGGFLGQRFLAQQHAVLIGLMLGCAAFLCLTIPTAFSLFCALSLSALSTGLIMPNIYDLLGKLYEKHTPGRDSAFTIAYTGMNVGALAGFLLAGVITHYLSYTSMFFISAAIFFITAVFFSLKMKLFPFQRLRSLGKTTHISFVFGIIALAALAIFGILHISAFSRFFIIGAGIFILLALSLLAYRYHKSDKIKSYKLILFIVLALVSIAFWAIYMLQPTMLVVFIERNVARELAGFTLSTASIMGFNPAFILVLGPLLSAWWLYQNRQGSVSLPTIKFAAGIFALGLAFACLAIGIQLAASAHVSLLWIVLFFFFLSIGEIIIAPAGYALIGLLIEEHLQSLVMGIWQLMTGVGGAISGELAQLATVPNAAALPPQATNHLYMVIFALFALISILIAILTLGLIKFQQKITK